MKAKTYLLLATLTLALISCSDRTVSVALNNVESYIQERPDSALKVIEAIDTTRLNTKALRAKYSLLYAMALDKNYVDTTDINIIQPATAYYTKHGSPLEKLQANFYRGCIHANRGEDDRAMHYYLMALEDSSKVTDNHYKELVNSAISDIFSHNNNTEQELLYTYQALKYGRMAGDSIGIWAITGHLASCYANEMKWNESQKAYDAFFSMPVYDTLSFMRRRISYAKDLLRFPDPSYNKSLSIIEDVAKTCPAAMTAEAYCIYAYVNQKLGNTQIATGILEQLENMQINPDVVKLWRYRIYLERGLYRQALEDLEQSVLVQDSIVVSSLSQSLIRSQRDFLQAETTILKKEKVLDKHRIVLILVLSFLILGAMVYLLIKREESFNNRIEELSTLQADALQMIDLQNAQAESVNKQLAQKDEALLSLRRQFAEMYKSQFKSLNDLCAAYLSPIKKDRKEVLYEEAMRQLDVIVNDTESQNKFMSRVNKSLDNILDKLREDLPGHKEQDFRFLMYVIAGFDATTISNLTGYSVGTVYIKKHRLKNEISALESPNKEMYLEFIS